MECENCSHDQDDHVWDEERGQTICLGDGRFDNGDPQCDCDMFEEFEEVED